MTSVEMLALFRRKIEDVAEKITDVNLYITLTNAQIEVVNRIDHHYLTEIKVINEDVTFTNGSANISGLNYEPFGGESGITDVKTDDDVFADRYDVSDLEIIENPYYEPTKNDPIFFVENNKIEVRPKTIKTADVYVLGEPKDIALGQNCELNVKLHRIIVRIAAAEIFGNKNKPIRRDGLLKLAYDEIDNLNEKYIIKESITPP